MLYAFGNEEFYDTFLVMYQSTVLGDTPLFTPVQEDHADPEMKTPVQVMIVFVSFVMGITMMNIFIAVLCEAYAGAHENAQAAFLLSRAGIVLDMHATRKGLELFTRLRDRRR